jgi:cytoskeleton protein RodZ
MNEANAPGASPPSGSSRAGDLLREARQAQGLEIDALASMIKVTPVKLDALERGRHDLLPDANFTRALAMTVCRSLKIDPAPVLADLPAAKAIPLSPNKPALNQPFKESRGANLSFDSGESFDVKTLLRPQWLAPILLLVASLVVYFLPDSIQLPHWPASHKAAVAEAPSAPMASAPESAASQVLDPINMPEIVPAPAGEASAASAAAEPSSAAPLGIEPAASKPVAASAPPAAQAPAPVAVAESSGGALVLMSHEPAWVEVRDGRGGVLLSRHLREGETVDLNGAPPLKLHIGNSSGLEVIYQGQPVALASYTRNNVARLELK